MYDEKLYGQETVNKLVYVEKGYDKKGGGYEKMDIQTKLVQQKMVNVENVGLKNVCV